MQVPQRHGLGDGNRRKNAMDNSIAITWWTVEKGSSKHEKGGRLRVFLDQKCLKILEGMQGSVRLWRSKQSPSGGKAQTERAHCMIWRVVLGPFNFQLYEVHALWKKVLREEQKQMLSSYTVSIVTLWGDEEDWNKGTAQNKPTKELLATYLEEYSTRVWVSSKRARMNAWLRWLAVLIWLEDISKILASFTATDGWFLLNGSNCRMQICHGSELVPELPSGYLITAIGRKWISAWVFHGSRHNVFSKRAQNLRWQGTWKRRRWRFLCLWCWLETSILSTVVLFRIDRNACSTICE